MRGHEVPQILLVVFRQPGTFKHWPQHVGVQLQEQPAALLLKGMYRELSTFTCVCTQSLVISICNAFTNHKFQDVFRELSLFTCAKNTSFGNFDLQSFHKPRAPGRVP